MKPSDKLKEDIREEIEINDIDEFKKCISTQIDEIIKNENLIGADLEDYVLKKLKDLVKIFKEIEKQNSYISGLTLMEGNNTNSKFMIFINNMIFNYITSKINKNDYKDLIVSMLEFEILVEKYEELHKTDPYRKNRYKDYNECSKLFKNAVEGSKLVDKGVRSYLK